MEGARRALEDTGDPLKRVATRAGFTDEQALRRAFVRHLGVQPAEYRKHFQAKAAM